MVQVQYIGDGHTTVQADKKVNEKVKVSNGEIIDVTPAVAKDIAYRGFQILEGEKEAPEKVTPTPKKKK